MKRSTPQSLKGGKRPPPPQDFRLTKKTGRFTKGQFLRPYYWKSKFLYRYRPEGIFRIFFGLILDPPGTYAFTAKKGKFICTGHFFPHGMAFLEKRGGLVPVYVFILPVLRTENGLTTDIFVVKYTGRGLVVKRPGVLSKVQMLNLVLGVGVFSLLPKSGKD